MESAAELLREDKWVKMFANWESFRTNQRSKLASRVMKGIPDCLRSRAWQELLDPAFQREATRRSSIDQLIRMRRQPCCDTIDVDINRTLTKMVMFTDEAHRGSLSRILHAYSNIDPEVGYVQGMAFPAAILLAYLEEERALWCFVRLMAGENCQLRHLFANGFHGLSELTQVWDILLGTRFKAVDTNLKSGQIMPALYTASWFLSTFMTLDMHPEVRLRLFDRLVAFGCRTLLSFGLTIVALNRDALAQDRPIDCLEMLQKPDQQQTMQNWRKVMATFDRMWLTEKEYENAFRKAGVSIFY
jgi:hypothetical protein